MSFSTISAPSITRFEDKIDCGYGFSVSHRFEAVASDASVDIYFENPSGSGRTIYIIAIEISTLAQAWADVYRGNTVSVSGTSITPVNLNFSSTISSIVNAEYGGTYTTGTLVHNTVIGGGTRVNAIGSLAEVGETVVIPPGNNLLVRATNKDTAASDISIRIVWWEG